MHTIFGDLDYVQGYLRMGHLEMELNDEDFEKFKSLSLKEYLVTLLPFSLLMTLIILNKKGDSFEPPLQL